jgi:hypothetical protein
MAAAVARSEELHEEFSHAVTCSRVEGSRRTADAVRLTQRTAREGRERPGYASAGTFRPSEIHRQHDRQAGRPCAFRWVTADIDATDPKAGERSRERAFTLARRLLDRLEDRGLDPEDVSITDTGGYGVHVRIPAGALGNPVFRSEHRAATLLRTFWRRLCGDDAELLSALDFTACRPGQLLRLPGTLHPDTGRRAVAVTGRQLRAFGSGYIYELTTAATYSPACLPDPTNAPFARRLAALLYRFGVQRSLPLRSEPPSKSHTGVNPHTDTDTTADAHRRTEADALSVRRLPERGGGKAAEKALPAATLRRLREPVAEGEAWGADVGWPRAVGRHFAANQLARHLAASQPSWTRERVERAVEGWNEEKNRPPLPRNQVRTAVRSAWRYVRAAP